MSYLKVEIFVPKKYVVELANDLNEADILKKAVTIMLFPPWKWKATGAPWREPILSTAR